MSSSNQAPGQVDRRGIVVLAQFGETPPTLLCFFCRKECGEEGKHHLVFSGHGKAFAQLRLRGELPQGCQVLPDSYGIVTRNRKVWVHNKCHSRFHQECVGMDLLTFLEQKPLWGYGCYMPKRQVEARREQAKPKFSSQPAGIRIEDMPPCMRPRLRAIASGGSRSSFKRSQQAKRR